jgi:hypothetical protein
MDPVFRSFLIGLPDDALVKLPLIIKESGRSRSTIYSAVKRGEITTLPAIGSPPVSTPLWVLNHEARASARSGTRRGMIACSEATTWAETSALRLSP